MGPGDVGPTRGLEPTEHGTPLLEAGSHTGTCASLGSSLWDSVAWQSFLDRHPETKSIAPQILKEREAVRGW